VGWVSAVSCSWLVTFVAPHGWYSQFLDHRHWTRPKPTLRSQPIAYRPERRVLCSVSDCFQSLDDLHTPDAEAASECCVERHGEVYLLSGRGG
jgi:hypothetical protein